MSIYPVLVYGTLRPGGSNYGHFLAGRTTNERTIGLNGFRMLGGQGYPYVIKGDAEDKIVGTLCDIDPAKYDDVVEGLDFLEGYRGPDEDNHYDRVLIKFTLGNGEVVKAWTYLANRSMVGRIVKNLPVVEHGDWLKFHNDYMEARFAQQEAEDAARQAKYAAEDEALARKVEAANVIGNLARMARKNAAEYTSFWELTAPAKTRMSRAQKKRAKKLASF